MASSSDNDSKARLRQLLKDRSVRQGVVKLSSGAESDWFVDCKQTALTGEGHLLVGAVMLNMLKELQLAPTAVAGVVLGGCPLASAVAHASSQTGAMLDAIYVRKQSKDHGTQRLIEGDQSLAPDAPIVVLEDVVTTGGSTLRALDVLRERPFQVLAVLALVDREEGGADAIRAAGVPFLAAFRRHDLEG